MSQVRKIKVLNEIIHSSYCSPKYVYANQDKVTFGQDKGRDAYFFEGALVGYITPEMLTEKGDMARLKEKLDQYMEFDSDELIMCGDLVTIFGGAIRDAIGGSPINDIDVLCTPHSRENIIRLLKANDYIYLEEMYKAPLEKLYTGIKIISMPLTFTKGEKIIQLIFPVTPDGYEKSHKNLISNVDISCCGLSYNGLHVYEDVEDAYLNAIEKTFRVCKDHKMYCQDRIHMRIRKFLDRGFVEITTKDKERINRIENIIKEDEQRDVLDIKPKYRWKSNYAQNW